MTRLEKFQSFADHPMHKKLLKRLSEKDRQECITWIKEHDHLGFHEYAHDANRWHLGMENKPKYWADMWALVFQANVRSEHESKS